MTNREKSNLIWLGLVLVACMFHPGIRRSLWQVVRAAAHPKIVGPVVALAAWTVGLVALAHMLDLWAWDERNDTVVWFLTVGIVMFFSLNQVQDGQFVSKTARRAVAGAVFVEAFVNLAVFSLPVELAIVPVASVLGLVAAFSDGKKEYAPAYGLVNGVLIFLGFCLFAFVLVQLVDDFDAAHIGRALMLPVWLTVGAVPFIYVVGLWSAYQAAFARIDLDADDAVRRRRSKRALVRAANVRAGELGGFAGHWIWDLTSTESEATASTLMRRWRSTWRVDRQRERLEDAREYMTDWLAEDDPTLAEIYGDVLRETWTQLDADQRAALKDEGVRVASTDALVGELVGLPD